ncbi:MAG: hypothetical protein K1X42_15025 [Opitutaceae bacterium]|nr:hypothetical protein [Opitutaceae bacterium]
MPSNPQSRVAGRALRVGGACVFVVTLALVAPGCSTGAQQVQARTGNSLVRVDVVNRTPYAWRLNFRREGNREQVVTVPLGRTVSVEILPGSYRIEQRAEGVSASPDFSRSIDESFEAGQHYRWPLVTLLSEPLSAPRS